MSMANLKIQAREPAPHTAAESLGWQLRAALPPIRVHCVAVLDGAGEVLWLSESVLGPDEQSFAAEALSELEAHPGAPHCDADLDDGRGAVFLAIRTPRAALAGVVMILVDAKALSAGNLPDRILTPVVSGLLDRLGKALPEPPEAQSVAPRAAETEAPDGEPLVQLDPVGEVTVEILAPQDVDEILTFELPQAMVAEDRTSPLAARRADPPAPAEPGLTIEELAKLRPGGRLRRFQVVQSLGKGASEDEAVASLRSCVEALLSWLAERADHREPPLSFSVPVSAEALEAGDLPQHLRECLGPAGARAPAIGFEIAESLYFRHREPIEGLIRTLEPLGSFLVLDDFTFDAGPFELLRSSALRLVKVHPELVSAALRDKLAQARIVAISQAARVLGIHCAAKQVSGPATRRWLTAAGFDFAQGPLFEGPRSLGTLAAELE